LNKLEYLDECTVIQRENSIGENVLCAYFTSGNNVGPGKIQEDMKGLVPGYMIPSYFVKLDKMPLTSNGKVDRNVLPDPGIIPGKEYIAPRNEVEEKIVEIWADLLKIEKNNVGIDNNFFENGGNSIMIMALHSKISAQLEIEDIPVVALFQKPSIRLFSDYLFGNCCNRNILKISRCG
jgi:acyl carrier protein